MGPLKELEKTLNDVFVKSAPALPKGLKEFLVKIAPWLVLLGGIFGILGVFAINSARSVLNNEFVRYADEYSRSVGGTGIEARDWNAMLLISAALLLVTSIIYFMAFSPLRKYEKKGWDLIFLAWLISLVSYVVSVFTWYSDFGRLLVQLIFSAIGLYIFFQVREYYTGEAKIGSGPTAHKSAAKPATKTTEKK